MDSGTTVCPDHYYHLGEPREQLAYLRLPKALLDSKYAHISAEAKVLYSVLLDRVALSARNRWADAQGRVYVICKVAEIQDIFHCANGKAGKILAELVRAGLITRQRRGQGKSDLIFVKKLTSQECSIDTPAGGNMDNPRDAHIARLEVHSEHAINNMDNNKTDRSKPTPPTAGEDAYNAYVSYYRARLDYDVLVDKYPGEQGIIDGILHVLADACATSKPTLRVDGEEKPAGIVREHLMRLDASHIDYVLDVLRRNTQPINAPNAYMLTVLYNAYYLTDVYYQAAVNHDYGPMV